MGFLEYNGYNNYVNGFIRNGGPFFHNFYKHTQTNPFYAVIFYSEFLIFSWMYSYSYSCVTKAVFETYFHYRFK